MRRRSKIRRALKWAGTIGCALLLGTLALSVSREVRWSSNSNGFAVLVHYGAVGFHRWRSTSSLYVPDGWLVSRTGASGWRARLKEIYWLPTVRRYVGIGSRRSIVTVPIWIPLIATALPTALLWWRNRRIPPGHCESCGYDLTGNVSGRCPECGTPVKAPAPHRETTST